MTKVTAPRCISTRSKCSQRKISRRTAACFAAVLASSAISSQINAASQTWVSNPVDASWSTAANWSGAAVPGIIGGSGNTTSADIVSFINPIDPVSQIGSASNPIQIDAPASGNARQVGGIIFDGNAGAYTIGTATGPSLWVSGASALAAQTRIQMNAAVTNSETIAAPLSLRLPSSTNGQFTFVNNATASNATLNFTNTILHTQTTRPITLTLDGSNTGNNTISGVLSTAAGANGAFNILKTGTGVWILSASNELPQKTSAGIQANVTINNGTLVAQNANALGTIDFSHTIITGGALKLDNVNLNNGNGGTTEGVTLGGTGAVFTNGSNTLQNIGVQNTATSVTLGTVNATDTLVAGGGGNQVSGGSAATVINVTGPGQAQVNNTTATTGTWQLNGTGSLVLGNGVSLNVASLGFGANTTGRIVLNGNSMTIGGLYSDPTSSPVLENASGSDLVLTINSATGLNQTYSGVIQDGAGGGKISLTKSGNGALTLNHNQTYTGPTVINGGRLLVNGNWATSQVDVNSGGTVGGSAIASGPVLIHSGGHIAPGSGVGQFTTAALTLDNGASLDYEFNNTSNDSITVSGSNAFTLNNAGFNLLQEGTQIGLLTQGTYNLVQFSGAIQGTGLDSTWTTASANNPHVLNPEPGLKYAFDTSGGFLRLLVTQGAFVGSWVVDADGSWSDGTNWSSNPTIPQNAGEVANFSKTLTATRTISMNGNKSLGALQFDAGGAGVGYTIVPGSGGNLTLDNLGNAAQINSISGTNTVAVPVVLAGNVAISTAISSSVAVTQSISGNGNVTKSGLGTLSLMASNSYSGSTTISAGTVEVGNNAAFSNSAVTFSGVAPLNVGLRDAGGDLTIGNAITLGDQVNLTIDTSSQTFTLGGTVSDTNSNATISKVGSGTLALTNNWTNAGTITVTAGTLMYGTGGTTVAPIVNNGAVFFNGASDATINSDIYGSGAVYKSGTNILTLSGPSTAYTGGTTVSAGTLRITTNGASGTGPMNLAGGATLDLQASPTYASLTGAGIVTTSNSATATITLNGTTSYVFDGSIQVPNGGTINLVKNAAGSIALTNSSTFGSIVAAGGTIDFNSATQTILATGNSTFTTGGALRFDGGTITLQDVTIPNSTSGDGSRLIITAGTVSMQNYSGGRSGGGSGGPDTTTGIQLSGGVVTANSIALATTNSWSTLNISGGSLSVGAGSFDLSPGNAAGRGGILIQSGGSLSYGQTLQLTTNNAIASATFSGGSATFGGIDLNANTNSAVGSGTLTMAGGTVYLGATGIMATNLMGLDANNNPTVPIGAVVLNSGTLGATADWAAVGTITTVDVNTGFPTSVAAPIPMTLTGNINLLAADANGVAHNITIAGNLSGSGGLTKQGAGTVTLSGSNSYTGVTAVAQGNLVLTNDGTNNAHTPVLTSGADITGGALILDYLGNAANDPAAADPAGFMGKFASGLIHSSNFRLGPVFVDDTADGKVKIYADYRGDANFDGSVTTSDFTTMAQHFGQTTSALWAAGDYNYDGVVNALDFNLVATNFGATPPLLPPSGAPVLGSVVPEPASLGMIGLALTALAGRRRRK